MTTAVASGGPVQRVSSPLGARPYRVVTPITVSSQRKVSAQLPSGRKVMPVGRLIGTSVMPTGVVVFHKKIAVLTDGPDPVQSVALYDPITLEKVGALRFTNRVAQEIEAKDHDSSQSSVTKKSEPREIAHQSLYQGLTVGPQGRLYAAGGVSDDVIAMASKRGHLHEVARYHLKWQRFPANQYPYWYQGKHRDGDRRFYPDGVCAAKNGPYLYATGLLANSLARVNTVTGKIAYVNAGPEPYGCAVSRNGSRVAVTDWGGTGVVVINAKTMRRVGIVNLGAKEGPGYRGAGLHPTAIATGSASKFWVALTNADKVDEINVDPLEVVRTLSVSPYVGAPMGSQPEALTSSDGRLYVANSGNNDVVVLDTDTGAPLGLIPTGWYPTALAIGPHGLYITSGKGLGVGRNCQGTWPASMVNGLLQRIALHNARRPHKAWKRQALRALRMNGEARLQRRRANEKATRWLRKHVRHVVFILRENKTFDEDLGDYRRAGHWADPHLALYNKRELPNLYHLATENALFTNFYVDGEVTAAAHQWTTGADESGYVQRTWPDYYSGRGLVANPGWTQPLFRLGFGPKGHPRGDNPYAQYQNLDALGAYSNPWISYPPRLYLFNDMLHHGISFEDFGEFVSRSKSGNISPVMHRHIALNYPAWDRMFLDTYRAKIVVKWFKDHRHRLPKFTYIWLPDDHTAGTNPCYFTPDYYVANNDLATGEVIAALSRMPGWRHTLVFITEDDTQSGADHINALRSFLVMAGPWVKAGALVTRHYSQVDVVRTIEAVLGIPPLSQWDANAKVIGGRVWRKRPDMAEYVVKSIHVPERINPGRCRSRWLRLRRDAGKDGHRLTVKWLKAHRAHRPVRVPSTEDAFYPTKLLSTPSTVMMRQEWLSVRGPKAWRRMRAYLRRYAIRHDAPLSHYMTHGDD